MSGDANVGGTFTTWKRNKLVRGGEVSAALLLCDVPVKQTATEDIVN